MSERSTSPDPGRREGFAPAPVPGLSVLALVAIVLIGSVFRFYNVNWDEGTYHIHPDERHTAMVVTAIDLPTSLGEYFDTGRSPLNPRNAGTVYFYGTLPLFLTKWVATLVDPLYTQLATLLPETEGPAAGPPPLTGYDQIHLVGRILSALFDLGSVLMLYFLTRRLFDWRVGLIASFLLALTVLNIQGSHYFAVDTFLTFFVTLTLWFTLDVAEGRGWGSFVGLGISMGLTLACKVSVFLLPVVIALGAWILIRRWSSAGKGTGRALLHASAGLLLAALIALAVFRVAQPYAWAGPGYDRWDTVPEPWGERLRLFERVPEPVRAVIMPDPQWIADILSAGAQQTGEADLPWGRQWTERTPWIYPLYNMVVWGMGVPLGIAAWLGVVLVIVQLGQSWRKGEGPTAGAATTSKGLLPSAMVLIPLAWVLLIFAWQGLQYVKSIRYYLPIYPFLALFAAYLVVEAWDWARARRRPARILAGALAGTVLLGTLAWAWAFIQIYREPVTRVQATRWMYANVETAATLSYRTVQGEVGHLQLPLPAEHRYEANGDWLLTPFTPPHDLVATQVAMNHLVGTEGPRQGLFQVVLAEIPYGDPPLSEAEIEATFGVERGGQCHVRIAQCRHVIDIPDVPLAGGQTYYLQTRPLLGAPLLSLGSAIANEHFDDPLPFNMDGRIAFGSGPYRGLDLTLYDEDTPEKLAKLLDVLDKADYISMSSGRLWQSIPRLPMRYPVTTRYYERLFAGELGFEKAAEFHSYPRLFGIEFNDTPAEEQFTVYDHPKVLIYRKTEAYNREQVRALLTEGIDWNSIPHWLNPRDVPAWRREQARQEREGARPGLPARAHNLMLTEEQRLIQEAGGTWASLFNGGSLPNRLPTLSWLLVLGLLGLAALPLTVAVFRRLPDRGTILARPVGVLLLAWLSWMLTNLTPLDYSRGTIGIAFGLIAALSLATLLAPGQRRRLAELGRRQWRLLLVTELLFLAFFALFWLIRWGNPDLWHPWKGGEKPMDFAYLNAVIKSTEFPPYDPWFAGGYLNYYYFGQVMVGTLIKLIGIVPAVAYNLAIPTWFAMTAMGAWTVTYNLVAREPAKGNGSTRWWRAAVFGLVGALFVAVLGNLGEIHLLLLRLGEGVMETFESTIPGLAGLVRLIIGSFEVVFGGRALPIDIGEWYWNASRVIPAGPYEAVINEFPFFTHLYADLHAHLIAMPLAFLSLALALAVAFEPASGGASRGEGTRVWPARFFATLRMTVLLVLWALAIGAMRTTNTWDVPPHLLVAVGALAIGEFTRRGHLSWRLIASVAWQSGLLFLLGWWLLYAPFWAYYGSFYNSIALWTGTRTPIWAFLVVHGLFLFLLTSHLVQRAVALGRPPAGSPAEEPSDVSAPALQFRQRPDPWLRRLVLTLRYRRRLPRLKRAASIVRVRGLPVGRVVWMGAAALLVVELFLLIPDLVPFTRAQPEAVEAGGFVYRGLGVFALGLPILTLGLLLLFRRGISPAERLWAYLVLLGLAMALGVEIIVLQGDIGRMNTVFKFYLQVWLMWGVAAAAALAWLVPHVTRRRHGRGLWWGILAALLLFAALYPPLATMAKVRDRFDPGLGPGLDGWAYMETAHYWDPAGVDYDLRWDLEAIQWLLDNVVGTPVILEGHTPEYRWGARYSINTGLPAVLGWNWHQRQQRAAAGDQQVWLRAEDVAAAYNTPIVAQAEELLRRYHVQYVIVGPLERAYYEPLGLTKFEAMVQAGTLQVAFRNQEVTVYKVVIQNSL